VMALMLWLDEVTIISVVMRQQHTEKATKACRLQAHKV
jgi:hypothetical protein